MESERDVELASLTVDELAALRLAAQVMGHRAHLAGSPQVGLYFESLEAAVMAEQAGRAQQLSAHNTSPGHHTSIGPTVLTPMVGSAEVQTAIEYLRLLTANDGLAPAIRQYCLQLQRAIAAGTGAS
ncbi:MAG TPA: hypothetical protein VEX62_12315 [Candidatus Limnocylindrales bacterium]|nr:hypothetical protein [Candidatus Limnocylindrales bacterium]